MPNDQPSRPQPARGSSLAAKPSRERSLLLTLLRLLALLVFLVAAVYLAHAIWGGIQFFQLRPGLDDPGLIPMMVDLPGLGLSVDTELVIGLVMLALFGGSSILLLATRSRREGPANVRLAVETAPEGVPPQDLPAQVTGEPARTATADGPATKFATVPSQWSTATQSAFVDSDPPTPHAVGARPVSPATVAADRTGQAAGGARPVSPIRSPSPAVAPAIPPRPAGQRPRIGPPRVFISHSSADNAFGRRLAADLEAKLGPGSVWYDSAGGLSGGDNWWDTITTELTNRPVFVVILSPQAMKSGWVHDELHMAWMQKNGERGKVIVPVVHQPADVPAYVATVQFVHFDNRPYERAFADLLGAVEESQTRLIRPQDVPTLRAGPPFQESELLMPERFVGRVEDLRWVEDRLRTGGATGITALRGLGGIGKTALAAVAVRELRWEDRFADGVAVQHCDNLTDAAALLRRVILQFDAQRQIAPEADLTALGDVAREVFAPHSDALVVLDNVEPGLDVAAVVRPLRSAGVTLLLTARHQLPRDAVPDEGSTSLKLLSTAEALDLFAQSYGRFAAPDLTPSEHAAALSIVRTLDHHTLAVKLAGAWAKDETLDLAKLADELARDPLKTPDDHENPRAVALMLGRSITALDADGQRLFAALAALPTNAFGRDALLALARGISLADPDASASLLVRRALLDATLDETLPAASDRERRRLHPLLRADALTRFTSATASATASAAWSDDERTAAARAVAEWYASYANGTDDGALGPDEDNIDGAIDIAAALDDDALLVALCEAMRDYWRDRSRTAVRQKYLPQGLAAAQRIAESSNGRDDWLALARLQLSCGDLLLLLGHISDAEEYIDKSITLRRTWNDERGEGVALSLLGDILVQRGDLAGAQANYERVLAIMRQVGDQREEGVALFKLGQVSEAQSNFSEAEDSYRRSLAILIDLQDALNYATGSLILGRLLILHQNKPEEGCQMLAEAASVYEQMGLGQQAEEARETARRLGCGT